MILGQVKTNEKSNKTAAIPELIGVPEPCIATIDATGSQKEIVREIRNKKAETEIREELKYADIGQYRILTGWQEKNKGFAEKL